MNNRYFLWLGCLFYGCAVSAGGMQLYEFFTDEFQKSKVDTEYDAYCLLKKTPLKSNVTYLAIPWAVFINKRKLDVLKKMNIFVENGFAICQHIQYEKILPLLKKYGVTTLFTPHVIKGKTYEGVRVLPFPHKSQNGSTDSVEKDLWYSFIGYNSHPVRKVLFSIKHPKNTVVKQRIYWHWARDSFSPGCNTQEQQQEEALEYQEILARSRFSLCPRGTGASTLRFWESLQSGAIPVLLADAMTLPEGFNWDRCVVTIAEKDADKIQLILKAITKESELAMREACYQAYALFSGENFVRCIRMHFDDDGSVLGL